MKREDEKETTDAFGVGKFSSKRTKLTERNISAAKDRRFYGEEAIPGDENQDADYDEIPFSRQNIQKELERYRKNKQKLKDVPKRYLKREQIEGEEVSPTRGSPWEPETQAEEIDEEGKDEIKIEPFHLSRELEEGSFDEEGTYIYHKDEEEILDNWLVGVGKEEIRKAKEAHEQRLRKQSEKELEEDERMINRWTKEELYGRLSNYMRSFETESVAQFLKELAKSEDKKTFEAVVELTQQLTSLGCYDIYDCSYDLVERRSHPSLLASNSPIDRIMWEYRWDEAQDVYGPFSTQMMADWQNQGYFPDTLMVRKVEEGRRGDFVFMNSLAPFSSFLPI
jgi:CD2 antigen cytoplasmic tail-binding protein 2